MTTEASFDITKPLPQGTVLLAASAGTGKTWTISAVCAKAIATGMVHMENLLLVTFNQLPVSCTDESTSVFLTPACC